MKKSVLSFARLFIVVSVMLFTGQVQNLSAQCLTAGEGQWPTTTFTPTCNISWEIIANNAWTDEYSKVNVDSGRFYIFGSSVATDYITISDNDGLMAYGTGTEFVLWTATFTGTVRFYTHDDSTCTGQQVNRIRAVACFNTAPCLNAGYGQYPTSTFTPSCTGMPEVITTLAYTDEYSLINVVIGNTYDFSSNSPDYFTISTGDGSFPLGWGFGPITGWVAPFTGTIRFYSHNSDDCSGEAVFRTREITCTAFSSGPCLTAGFGQYPSATFTPTCTGMPEVIINDAWTDEYSLVNVVNGENYVFSSNSATDYLTISDDMGTMAYAWGTQPVSWTATFTGVIRFYSHDDEFCTGQQVFRTREVACGSLPCLTATHGLFPTATFNPTCTGLPQNITTCGWASEYSNVNVVSGETYEFSSSIATDYITIGDSTGTMAYVWGTTPISWTSTVTGVIRFYTHLDDQCGDEDVCRIKRVSCGTVQPPPANDLCSGAIQVMCGGNYTGSTTYATNTDNGPMCVTSASTAPAVWYYFIGTGDSVELDLCQSSFDTKIFVYTGGGCPFFSTCVAGNDDACGLQSVVNFLSMPGVTYYIMVAGFGTQSGNYDLTVTCTSTACDEPSTVWTSDITPKSAVLNWDAVPGAVSYIVRGREVGKPNWIYLPSTTNMLNVTSGIHNGFDYEWQVRTVCAADSSGWSPMSYFSAGCFAPEVLWTDSVTTNSAILSWTEDPGAQDGYQIRGRKVGSSGGTTFLVSYGTSTFSVAGLDPGTDYEWRIRSICEMSTNSYSDWTAWELFTTDGLPARLGLSDPFDNATGMNVMPNPFDRQAVVSWSNPENEVFTLRMIDVSGREVKRFEGLTGEQFILNKDNIQAGVYFIEVSGSNTFRTKVVVQ